MCLQTDVQCNPCDRSGVTIFTDLQKLLLIRVFVTDFHFPAYEFSYV